ncbi:hypothetical protein, partial [Streptomyces parvus]|uniref:hypothetical protein n=1 Tax=Streptomyces parvus TaxID=66428 RepID=UPI0033DCB6AE
KPVPVVAPRGSVLTRAARRDLLQDDFNHVVLPLSGPGPSGTGGCQRRCCESATVTSTRWNSLRSL